MKRRLHTLRRAIADDRGVIGPAVAMLLIVVLIGAGLVFDGGRALAARRQAINTAEAAARAGVATVTADGLREDPARAATLDFLDAAGVARTRHRVNHGHRDHGHRRADGSSGRGVRPTDRQRQHRRARQRPSNSNVREQPMIRRALRILARLTAGLIVVAVLTVPVVLMARVAGNPFGGDLLRRVQDRTVDDATILRLLSIGFYVLWAWFALPAIRQARLCLKARHPRPSAQASPRSVPVVVDRGPQGWLTRLVRYALDFVHDRRDHHHDHARRVPLLRALQHAWLHAGHRPTCRDGRRERRSPLDSVRAQ